METRRQRMMVWRIPGTNQYKTSEGGVHLALPDDRVARSRQKQINTRQEKAHSSLFCLKIMKQDQDWKTSLQHLKMAKKTLFA